MSSEAVADARLALLYHSVWDRHVAVETFARWGREDFVDLAGVAEAIWAYDRTDSPYVEGVDRVLGVSQTLHSWASELEGYRREHTAFLAGRDGASEPADPFPTVYVGKGRVDAPNHLLRRLAGSVLRSGAFAHVVAPGRTWISRTSTDQLHRVLQVEANRRTSIMGRTRDAQMAQGAREVATQVAADRAIDWAPIEARLQRRVIGKNVVFMIGVCRMVARESRGD